jgi:signal transduction histidine kinase
LDSYQENFVFGNVDFSGLVLDTVDRMHDRADNAGIEMKTNIKPDVFVKGDYDKLVQVLVNILDNSIKYSHSGNGVEIKLAVLDKCALLTVTDQGCGIPEEDLEKVFDRFYRADPSRNVTTGGSGLGLAIAKQIIEGHEGRIWAESEYGVGTTIYFMLKKV